MGPKNYWGRINIGFDCDGNFEIILENSRLFCKYGWTMESAHAETYITSFVDKKTGIDNITRHGHRIDAASSRGPVKCAAVLHDTPEYKTVRCEWFPIHGETAVSDITIFKDQPYIRVDYLNWFVNIVDITSPGGAAKGVYKIYGQESWKRDIVFHEDAYFDRYPGDVGQMNITEIDEPGPLNYNGCFIMGLYDEKTGYGFGRVSPVEETDIIKLLWGEGFEIFGCFGRKHIPFFNYIYLVTGGDEEIMALGKQIADRNSRT